MLHARKIDHSFAMATNQIEPVWTKLIWMLKTTQETLLFLNGIFSLENLAFRLPWPPIKISDLDKIHMVGRGLLQKHFSKTFVKISAVTKINANFLFSHYKYMETLSCHSNKSTWAMTIKNIIYVEADVINIYAKFQLHPPYGFWEADFWINISKI